MGQAPFGEPDLFLRRWTLPGPVPITHEAHRVDNSLGGAAGEFDDWKVGQHPSVIGEMPLFPEESSRYFLTRDEDNFKTIAG